MAGSADLLSRSAALKARLRKLRGYDTRILSSAPPQNRATLHAPLRRVDTKIRHFDSPRADRGAPLFRGEAYHSRKRYVYFFSKVAEVCKRRRAKHGCGGVIRPHEQWRERPPRVFWRGSGNQEIREERAVAKLEALRLGPRVGSAILAMSWNGDLPNLGEGSGLAPRNPL